MVVRAWQLENAPSPMEVTLSGMVMLFKLQQENALLPMEVTLLGMVTVSYTHLDVYKRQDDG